MGAIAHLNKRKKMRFNKTAIIAAVGLAATLVIAASATYVQKTASGTTSATVIFSGDAQKQTRIVGLVASSDKATSTISLRSGTTAFVIATANTNTAATNVILSTVGSLASNNVVLLQLGATNVQRTVWGTIGTTNLVLTSTVGGAQAVGDQVFLASAATTLNLGAVTNYAAPAFYVGSSAGRPVSIIVDGTSNCSIDTVTVIKE